MTNFLLCFCVKFTRKYTAFRILTFLAFFSRQSSRNPVKRHIHLFKIKNSMPSRSRFLSPKFISLLSIGLLGLFQANSIAQDISLPGDETPTAAPTATDEDAAPKKQNLIGLIMQGGWAMFPLFAMLFAVIALAVYLFMDISAKNFNPPELVARLDQSMSEADLEGTLATAEVSPTCLGQVTHATVEYIWDRGYETLDGDTIFDLMADASQEFNRKRASVINWFSVISQAAPMVGLLGTVSGMIKAFGTLASGGMGDPSLLAGNISEALVTTASGLVIAIPAIFGYFFFRDKLTGEVAAVEKNLSRMLNHLRRRVVEMEGEEEAPEAGAPPAL